MTHPDLLVGLETGDDAAVWRRPDGRALVATVDFFTPVVDDARTWGAIAAANAVSDVYAMGGAPLFALNIAVWPKDELPLDLLGEVLSGANDIAAQGGYVVVGGHTIDGAEPLYGQVVVGEVNEGHILTNAGARAGESVVLTKALGTGIITTAIKLERATRGMQDAAIASMTRLNFEASAAALRAGARCATDVTGFGLLGHIYKLALASGVAVELDVDELPILPGVQQLAEEGCFPGGTTRNLDFAAHRVKSADRGRWESWKMLVADPQTSGGLLFTCSPDAADAAVATLQATGHAAAVIGRVAIGPPGEIRI